MIDNNNRGIVLVADDSPDSLGILNTALTKAGFTVLIAMDGVQALSIAGKMIPDIILLDAIMPNLNGFETCKQIKQHTELSDIPVIFMTGLSDTEHVIEGLESGGVDYINKPIQLDELFARIRVHLSNSRITRGARNALNEIGQLSFASDINGKILWTTEAAKELLGSISFAQEISTQIKKWLKRNPDKNSHLTIKDTQQLTQIRYLGQTAPGEFLLRLIEDNEEKNREKLQKEFNLTQREAEVLFWLSKGKSNQDIAQILSLSPRTINKHLEQVYKKLGVENRTSAASASLLFLNH
ncbi:MAG: response regulator [Cellvibrionaceae bacterium]